MNSLRRALLIALLGTLGLAILAASLLTYRMAQRELDGVFDYHLRQIALSLRGQGHQALPPGGLAGAEDFDFVIRIWDRSGVTVFYSRPHRALPELAQLGFSTATTPEGEWRLFAIQYGFETIEVAQPMRVRQRLARAAALRTLTPFFVLLPLLALLVWLIVRRGLAPLERLARSVGARTPSALAALDERGVPLEAQPLVAALNGLLGRLAAALRAQQDFIADAAHELRTPLAAVQLQAQLVERARDADERRAALAELRQGLARAERLVQQLLTLARAQPEAPAPPFERLDLLETARAAIAEQVPFAAARGIDLGLEPSGAQAPIALRGDADALRTLLANLLGNALRHTPAGGRIDVLLGLDDGQPVLRVADSGPGIPPEERERVFDRFYRRAAAEGSEGAEGSRGTEAAEAGGSGLGLAIVRAIAERHGAKVSLGSTASGGLQVTVVFPPAGGAP